MQKEKHTPSTRVWIRRSYDQNGNYTGGDYWNMPSRTETIIYDDGPRFAGDANAWKKCDHRVSVGSTGYYVDVTLRRTSRFYPSLFFGYDYIHLMNTTNPGVIPEGTFDRNLAGNIRDQLDLNVSESVLLYSGVIQAVPLLGSVFTFNKIMRRIAKKMKKSFLKQPFTTVVKSAISLDFINRFVISPTLDDAVKFAQATNYCLNVINTAHERNNSRFALSAESFVGTKSQRHVTEDRYPATVDYDETTTVGSTSKLFVLIDADYDVQAISPIKLWAARVGLTKPLDSVWDLVPFSFVIDYFTRAGDFIAELSNEMSSQEGLRGKITNIYGAWGSLKSERTVTRKGTGYRLYDGNFTIKDGPLFAEQTWTGYRYTRFPVDFGLLLNSLPTDNALINVNLSSTRARTLAELFIQAKL